MAPRVRHAATTVLCFLSAVTAVWKEHTEEVCASSQSLFQMRAERSGWHGRRRGSQSTCIVAIASSGRIEYSQNGRGKDCPLSCRQELEIMLRRIHIDSPNGNGSSAKTKPWAVENWFNCCNDDRRGYCSGYCSGNKAKARRGIEIVGQANKNPIKEDCIKHNKVWTDGGIALWDPKNDEEKYKNRGECEYMEDFDIKTHSRVWIYGGNYWGHNKWCPKKP